MITLSTNLEGDSFYSWDTQRCLVQKLLIDKICDNKKGAAVCSRIVRLRNAAILFLLRKLSKHVTINNTITQQA